jgi:hypothetical protein
MNDAVKNRGETLTNFRSANLPLHCPMNCKRIGNPIAHSHLFGLPLEIRIIILLSLLGTGLLSVFPAWARSNQYPSQPVSQQSSRSFQLISRQSSASWRSNAQGHFESEGRPPSRTSAGSRDICTAQLIALVPGQEDLSSEATGCSVASESWLALTLEQQPIFWFYVPAQPDAGATAEFALLDENQQPILLQSMTLTGEAGIIGVPLTQPLVPGQIYRWAFSMMGSRPAHDLHLFVEGRVQRIEPDAALATQLSTASEPDRLAIYLQQGIWHDALTSLVAWHHRDPTDSTWADQWSKLLAAVGLETIAQAPLLDCCTPHAQPSF